MKVIYSLFLFTLPFLSQAQVQPAAKKDAVKIFFEKVYLHTDRGQYAAGEDIWFKAYLVNAQTNLLFTSSNNLYVELISPDATISDRKVIRLDNGLGNGDFHLGDSIPTGIYRLRAYTNWMRNFGDNFIFEKTIRVYGVDAAGAAVKNVQANEKKPVTPTTTSNKATGASPGDTAAPAIRFFPEGGSMTEGVSGFVAFRTIGNEGKGTAAQGKIFTGTGTEVAVFSSDEDGNGLFLLSPVAGTKYIAKGELSGGRPFSIELPAALSAGFAMNIRNADSLLRVTLSTNPATFASYKDQPLLLIFRSKGRAYRSIAVRLTGLQAMLTVVKDNFPSGISSITLTDTLGKPYCERLFYHQGEKANLAISTGQSSYGPKGKTTLTVKTTDQHGQPVKANLSLAVTDAGITTANQQDIVSYLNLQSELRGEIEHPGKYFDLQNPNRSQQLELLLLTQGWRDYTWKRLADSVGRISRAPEQGITVSGTVKDKQQPLTGANISLSALGARGTKLFTTRTDTAGRYYVDGVGLYGAQALRLSAVNDKGQPAGQVTIDSVFAPPLPVAAPVVAAASAETVATASLSEKLAERQAAVTKIRLSDTIGLQEVKITTGYTRPAGTPLTTFGYKDEIYTITAADHDYRDLYHYLQHRSKAFVGDVYFWMDEVTFDITKVDVYAPPPKPSGSLPYESYRLLYYRGAYPKFAFPRIFVNGKQKTFNDEKQYLPIMAAAQQEYLSMPVEKTEKIVIRHLVEPSKVTTSATSLSRVEPISDVYLLYLTFKPGALDAIERGIATAQVNGYYTARTFYAPEYDIPSAKADLRTTIFWAPAVTTDENGEATITYYNADPKTKVRIVAEGITSNGIPVAGTAGYEVK